MRAPKPGVWPHQMKRSFSPAISASRTRFVRRIELPFATASQQPESNRNQTPGNSRQLSAVLCGGRILIFNTLRSSRQLGDTTGKRSFYVDIVGVTGSIPVAPTIFFNRLGHYW